MKIFEKYSDEQLIQLILGQDKDALGELYNRYFKKVYHKCLSITKDPDEAFDLAQEALIKAFDKLKNFRGDSSFSTWLFIITHRFCLESFRKASKKLISKSEIVLAEACDKMIDTADQTEDRAEMESVMLSLVNSLPKNERELLFLKYSSGESIESLQIMLHLSASAIKMRLKRAKEKLNQLYMETQTLGVTENFLAHVHA